MLPDVFKDNFLFDFMGDIPEAVHSRSVLKTDVRETDTAYLLDIEVPGIKKEDIKVKLEDGYLNVSATTKVKKEDTNEKYVRKERYFGAVSRSFYVGEDLTEEDVKANYENGILHLTVVKKEAKVETNGTKVITIE